MKNDKIGAILRHAEVGLGLSPTEQMAEAFGQKGLATPPIPEVLCDELRILGPWCWATRPIDPLLMYLFAEYPIEATQGSDTDYAAVSHAGHGVNSYSINYHLVLGPLALFLQTAWGGIYLDNEAQAATLARQFSRVSELIAAVRDSEMETRGRGRLIVLDSDFRDIGVCEWLERPLEDGSEARRWLRRHNGAELPLEAGIRLLRGFTTT